MASRIANFFTAGLAGLFVLLRVYGWLLIAVCVGILTIGAITEREATAIAAIEPVVHPLEGSANLVEPGELLELLASSFTKPLDQLHLHDIDIERVEEILEQQAFVGEAEAYIDADMVLHLTATQRIPLLRIMAANGQNYYLDLEGTKLPLSVNYTVRVPVVTGEVVAWSDDYLGRANSPLRHLYDLAWLLRDDPFLSALIEQIDVTEKGEFVLAPKIGDQIIYLGRFDKELTPLRLQRLKTFYREGLPYEGWRKYRSFDLRYADQVVAKKT